MNKIIVRKGQKLLLPLTKFLLYSIKILFNKNTLLQIHPWGILKGELQVHVPYSVSYFCKIVKKKMLKIYEWNQWKEGENEKKTKKKKRVIICNAS